MMNPKQDVWEQLHGSEIGYALLTNQLHTRDATIVELTIGAPEQQTFYGTSRRSAIDKPNDDIGYKLAMGRALRQAGRALIKEANRQVREQERVRQTHLRASRLAQQRREMQKLTRNLAISLLEEDDEFAAPNMNGTLDIKYVVQE